MNQVQLCLGLQFVTYRSRIFYLLSKYKYISSCRNSYLYLFFRKSMRTSLIAHIQNHCLRDRIFSVLCIRVKTNTRYIGEQSIDVSMALKQLKTLGFRDVTERWNINSATRPCSPCQLHRGKTEDACHRGRRSVEDASVCDSANAQRASIHKPRRRCDPAAVLKYGNKCE